MRKKRKVQSEKRKVKAQSLKLLSFCFSFALCAFSFALISGCAKREIKNMGSQGKNIICFGDSITFGYGVSQGEDYPSALAKLTAFPVINAGIDGDTTFEALKRIEGDVLGKDPLLVIIEFSGNDFLRKVPKEVTVDNIRKMAEYAQARGAMVAIADISAGMFLAEYRSLLNNLAKEKKAVFIPAVLNGIITNPSLKSDFLHPNAEGYKIVARRIHQAILPYLKPKVGVIN